MEYKVKSFSFFKVGNHYETTSNGEHCVFSADMFECMKRQYLLMGFKVFWETDLFISFSKVENAIDVFLDRLNNKN